MHRLTLLALTAVLILAACGAQAPVPESQAAAVTLAAAATPVAAQPAPQVAPTLTSPTAPQLCALIVTRTAQSQTAVLDATSPACPAQGSERYVVVDVLDGGVLTVTWRVQLGNTITAPLSSTFRRPDAGPIARQ